MATSDETVFIGCSIYFTVYSYILALFISPCVISLWMLYLGKEKECMCVCGGRGGEERAKIGLVKGRRWKIGPESGIL